MIAPLKRPIQAAHGVVEDKRGKVNNHTGERRQESSRTGSERKLEMNASSGGRDERRQNDRIHWATKRIAKSPAQWSP
jgi:hypothetical protein